MSVIHRHRKLLGIRGAPVLHKAQCFLGGVWGHATLENLHALRRILVQSGANVNLKISYSVLSSLSCGMEKYWVS